MRGRGWRSGWRRFSRFFESTRGRNESGGARHYRRGAKYSAVDAFEAEYRLRALRRDAEREWSRMDVLVVPSAPTIYTHEEIAS